MEMEAVEVQVVGDLPIILNSPFNPSVTIFHFVSYDVNFLLLWINYLSVAISNSYSSYTNFFGNLLTLDQKRELLQDEPESEVYLTENPYVLRDQAKSEFRDSLKSNGNYSFGGVSPFKVNKKASSALRQYTQQKMNAKKSLWTRPANEMTPNERFYPSKSRKMLGQQSMNEISKSFVMPGGKSIYELVSQKIDLPHGLLYRGKYCGKSKLRDRMHEYGDQPRIQSSQEELSTVQPMMPDSKSARNLLLKANRKQSNSNGMSRNGHKSKAIRSVKNASEINKLKQMKKFYPEEYFKRSGYPFEAMSQQNDKVYFKNKLNKQQDNDFNRFNEELVYPTSESKVGGDTRSQIRRNDLDRFSSYSKQSRTPMAGGDASTKISQRTRGSQSKYLRDAQSI